MKARELLGLKPESEFGEGKSTVRFSHFKSLITRLKRSELGQTPSDPDLLQYYSTGAGFREWERVS